MKTIKPSFINSLVLISAMLAHSAEIQAQPGGFYGGQGKKGMKGEKGMKGGKGGKWKNENNSQSPSNDKWKYVKDPVAFYFPGYDKDSDGLLSVEEWQNRGNFEALDSDSDGYIDKKEFAKLYARNLSEQKVRSNSTTDEIDPDYLSYKITKEEVGLNAICTITRAPVCQNGDETAASKGLIETGLGPIFPEGSVCRGIDEIFAMDYREKTGKGMHGGIDIPADFGTPILAVADGTIVGKFDPEFNARGKTIVIRHTPEDTGLPYWVYTEYAHMDRLPDKEVGSRVEVGEMLGPTGNTGISRKNKRGISTRRPGIHFAVYYSTSPQYSAINSYIIPKDPSWMDSNALYRASVPYDSQSLQELDASSKLVNIAVKYRNGDITPAGSRIVWPYACRRI